MPSRCRRTTTALDTGPRLSLAGTPAGQVEGNRVAVDYLRRDSYIPMASEIVAGAADNEIHAAGGVLEFVDGGLMGKVLVLKSRRWRDGERCLRAANDVQWRRQA